MEYIFVIVILLEEFYSSEEKLSAIKNGKIILNDYLITEKEQMLPLYGLTLKRNEYLVIWNEPNNLEENNNNDYLKMAKNILYEVEKINVYIENSTEKALELIKRKKYNKIILISNIGKDLSGKKFVEIARKILGFDVMVLFFSRDNSHLNWIQHFPNFLYTNNPTFFEKYIKNYNEKGLLDLKSEIEKNYKIKLKFLNNFLDFPKFIDKTEFGNIIFNEVCPYFRKVIIRNKYTKKALYMKGDRKVEFKSYEGKEINSLLWYVTLSNEEITLYRIILIFIWMIIK